MRRFYGWVVVAGAFTVLFVAYGAQYTFGVFFAALLDEFGWSRATCRAPSRCTRSPAACSAFPPVA